MTAKDQAKVIRKGFKIIRCQDEPTPHIKIKDIANGEWHHLEKFKNKAQRDRAFNDLLKLEHFIAD
jgi:hypothetical protein